MKVVILAETTPSVPPPVGDEVAVEPQPVPTVVEINGLKVELNENLDCTIVDATNEDQAAELCAAHQIPVDMAQFTHVEKAGTPDEITVSYNLAGERVVTSTQPLTETPPDPSPENPAEVPTEAASVESAPAEEAPPVETPAEPPSEPASADPPETVPSTEVPPGVPPIADVPDPTVDQLAEMSFADLSLLAQEAGLGDFDVTDKRAAAEAIVAARAAKQ